MVYIRLFGVFILKKKGGGELIFCCLDRNKVNTSKLLKGFAILAIKIQFRQLQHLSSAFHYYLWECIMVKLAAGGLPHCSRSTLEAS